jgi:predicted small lipoprotein YifL
MRFTNPDRSASMATLSRTIRTLVVAAAVLALMAPVAQAKPLEVPPGPLHSPAAKTTQTQPDASFGWTDAAIGAALVAVLIGVGVSGARLSHRRTAPA